ncbi:MAG: hypothetical protein U0835_00315 [Isosphaeraceae bacterium]
MTDAFDAILVARHKEGLTDVQITAAMCAAGLQVKAAKVGNARRRLGLPPNRSQTSPTAQLELPPPKPKANPISFAKDRLEGRMTERAGSYWLDGSPVRLDELMRAANREAIAEGIDPLLASERWRP